jgi:hypothetical protein
MRKEPLSKGIPYALRSTQYSLGATETHSPHLLALIVGRTRQVRSGKEIAFRDPNYRRENVGCNTVSRSTDGQGA